MLKNYFFSFYFFLYGDVESRELAVQVHGPGQGRLEEVLLVLRVQLSVVPAHELGLVGGEVGALKKGRKTGQIRKTLKFNLPNAPKSPT